MDCITLLKDRRHWKNGRSHIHTRGICNSVQGHPDLRFFFFDVDRKDTKYGNLTRLAYLRDVMRVNEICRKWRIDYLVHQTKNGIHFLSPTLISKTVWKAMMEELKDVNPRCPQNTLRTVANKHRGEEEYFYNAIAAMFPINKHNNSKNMAEFLNYHFGTHFDFDRRLDYELIHVRYPLPLA